MKIVYITPHFEPDVAPTGAVATRLVHELAQRNHVIDVVTALPWYRDHRVDPSFAGRTVRVEDAPWGRITRVDPFPTRDKLNIAKRAIGYAGFSTLAGYQAARGGPADVVVAMSPPLTLGFAGIAAARKRRAPLVFNVQDVFPDVAVELGYLRNPRLIGLARRMERFVYERSAAVTVLSEDLRHNVASKFSAPERVKVIPNFVDTEAIRPGRKENAYRGDHGLSGKFVVMYAGNVGLSQALVPVMDAAAALAQEPDIVFVINGQGAQRAELEKRARGMSNVVFVDMQPAERLAEVLAAADVHLVPLKRGLAQASVPSKTYSILAASRPVLASVDPFSEIATLVERAGAGLALPPEDAEALAKSVTRLHQAPAEVERMGAAGRSFVESWASPAAVAASYEELFAGLRDRP
jgi:colanic acid biosynthesis glycosyl transferase WcaI